MRRGQHDTDTLIAGSAARSDENSRRAITLAFEMVDPISAGYTQAPRSRSANRQIWAYLLLLNAMHVTDVGRCAGDPAIDHLE
jgi:hypothetical protein